MAMTLQEIKDKAKFNYDHVDDINSMAEAKQAVREGYSMIFYMADNVIDLAEEAKKTKEPK